MDSESKLTLPALASMCLSPKGHELNLERLRTYRDFGRGHHLGCSPQKSAKEFHGLVLKCKIKLLQIRGCGGRGIPVSCAF